MKQLSYNDRDQKIDFIIHVLGSLFPDNPQYRYAYLESKNISNQWIKDRYEMAVEVLSERNGSLE